ncbi:LuxR C-terminal-related transcriptional regulator [Paenibacillus tyrfis]|uniref:HTH luxR-type domain-containing protein n=1 Tax=Paenibacillus tyrfis TaxID=1501230 RepID=A0A081NUJ3_9BACL|nr:LuxR C-terminal-related transcriptional regulator [Paenibacillus tyrfis]KEQ22116.1 hypothetical protein ET33_27965 [Paenibacillus tyrfis]
MNNNLNFNSASLNDLGRVVLASKVTIPRSAENDILRPRLIEMLDQSSRFRLTLVTAPAGFGKTTLVSGWVHYRCVKAAWVSLDSGNNELLSFWIDVSYAIDKQFPGFTSIAVPILHSFKGDAAESAIPFFLQELDRITEPCVLIMDDYHVIENSTVHDSLSFVIRHLPEHIRLVLISRTIPPLPLPRLRISKQMVQIDGSHLRFTLKEIQALQKKSMNVLLSPSDLTILEQKTEGWVAGLILAFLSIEGRSDASAFIESFSGSNRYIIDYLVDEVLARQSEELQAFLLQTSILTSICASLAEAVTDQSNALKFLADLERGHMFLNPLDDTRTWYRYHQLFGEMLRDRLNNKLNRIEVEVLHRRAYRWLDQNGLFMESIGHAFQAGDHAAAAECMDRHLHVIIHNGDEAALLHWLGQLTLRDIVDHPNLVHFHAGALAQSGCIEEAMNLMDQALQLLGTKKDLPPEAIKDMEQQMGLFRASIAFYQGNIDALIDHLNATMNELTDTASIVKVTNLSEPLLYRGPLGFGGRLHKVIELSKVPESDKNQAQLVLQDYGFVLVADVYYEWNLLDEAQRILEHALAVHFSPQVLEFVTPGIILLSKIFQARGEWGEAERTIQEMIRHIETYPSKRWLLMLEARLVRLRLVQGDVDTGLRWMEWRNLQSIDKPNVAREYEILTVVRLLLKQGRTEHAVRLLKQLERDVVRANRLGSRIEIALMLALAYKDSGKSLSAMKALEEACHLAAAEGYVRIFIDEGKPLTDLLSKSGLAYAHQLLGIQPESQNLQDVTLTNREQEILRFIAEGRSNDEIARILHLSDGTVKRYTHHLYQKLEVKNRVQAVSRAKELYLL